MRGQQQGPAARKICGALCIVREHGWVLRDAALGKRSPFPGWCVRELAVRSVVSKRVVHSIGLGLERGHGFGARFALALRDLGACGLRRRVDAVASGWSLPCCRF